MLLFVALLYKFTKMSCRESVVRAGSFYAASTRNWQTKLLPASFNSNRVVQSGTVPNAQMQLMSSSYTGASTNMYNILPIQKSNWFVASFMLKMNGGGDEMFFYAGATDTITCGVSCYSLFTTYNKGGVVVGFDAYPGFGGGGGRSGLGIYLMNGAGSIVASSNVAFSANSVWESVTIAYTKGTTNTWVVSWKGMTVLTYSDPSNPGWVSSAGNYWGVGARVGSATGNFYIMGLSLAFSLSPGTNQLGQP